MHPIVFLTVILNIFSFTYGRNKGCAIHPRTDVPHDMQPLYLMLRQLAQPEQIGTNFSINVQSGSKMTFACTGGGNSLVNGDQIEEGVCVDGTTFLIEGSPVRINDMHCRHSVKASLLETDDECAYPGSYTNEVGFKVNKDWLKLYKICYNPDEERTVHVHHVVSSLLFRGDEKNSDRPNFVVGLKHLAPGYNPDDIYTKKYQQQVFEKLLPSADYFDMKKTYLHKGHLAPDADFMLTNWQFATYFYVNVAPQWSTMNTGNWLVIENKVRLLADTIGVDLEVWTGSSGLLQLLDGEKVRDMYLGPIPIPAYFWKVVQRPDTREAVAFVVENDPYKVVERKQPCKNACKANGWKFRDSVLRGTVYCCPVTASLRNLIPGIPEIRTRSILKNVRSTYNLDY